METQSKRSSGWLLLIPVLVLVFGCLLATILFSTGVANMVGWAIDLNDDIEDMQRVIVPGEGRLALSEPGSYVVFYEYRSSVDGQRYVGRRTTPPLKCDLTAQDTGQEVRLNPAKLDMAQYENGVNGRSGIWFLDFEIDSPGVYNLNCQYATGGTQPRLVLAVGHNFIWDSLRSAPGWIGAFLGGPALACGSVFLGLLLFVLVLALRAVNRPAPSPATP